MSKKRAEQEKKRVSQLVNDFFNPTARKKERKVPNKSTPATESTETPQVPNKEDIPAQEQALD